MLTAVAGEPSTTSLRPMILVVEDDVLTRLVVAEYLREAGFGVIEAASARDALDVIGSRTRVDLVFTDNNMPGDLDGCVLAKHLADRQPAIPVILTSGALTAGSGAARGPWYFMAKPYAVAEVEQRIRALLAGAPPTAPGD